jgi:hypothetical protein
LKVKSVTAKKSVASEKAFLRHKFCHEESWQKLFKNEGTGIHISIEHLFGHDAT